MLVNKKGKKMKNQKGKGQTPARIESTKRSSREKSTALELVGNMIQLYKIQGTLLYKIQDQIRKMTN
jgi:hypothetical protein